MTKHKSYEKWVPIIVIAAIVVAAVVGVAVAVQPFEDASGCKSLGKAYTMTVRDNDVTPAHVQAKKCDTLKIVNEASDARTIMFGHPEDMETYDGIMEKHLETGASFTVTLGEVGDFHIHEHTHLLSGTFTVQ